MTYWSFVEHHYPPTPSLLADIVVILLVDPAELGQLAMWCTPTLFPAACRHDANVTPDQKDAHKYTIATLLIEL